MFFAKLNNIHIICKFIVHSKHHLVPLLFLSYQANAFALAQHAQVCLADYFFMVSSAALTAAEAASPAALAASTASCMASEAA